MRPVLFYVGSFPIYAYSLCVMLAYLFSLGYGILETRRVGQDPIHAMDISIWIFVAGIAGARLLFIVTAWKWFLAHPLEVFMLWKGGLVYFGGLFGAVAGGWIYVKRHGLGTGQWADIAAPTAMIDLVVGRIGCFLNGCCYGKVAPDLPWGVVYPVSHSALGLAQLPVHPTPLYESLATLIIFIFLVVLSRRKRFQGEVFWWMVICYSVARFLIEFYRGDPRGSVGWGLSTSQSIALITLPVSIVVLGLLYRRYLTSALGSEERAADPGLPGGSGP